MDLNGEISINALRQQVWSALNDAVVLQACIPGCEQVVDESPTVRRATVMVKMGPVRARFQGRVTLSDIAEPERCTMSFEGSGGAAGMASGRSQVELFEDGAATRLTYTVKASVGGKLGQIGGRMMDASAKQLADQFFAALRERLEPGADPATDTAPAVPDAATPGAGPDALLASGGAHAVPMAAAHAAYPADAMPRIVPQPAVLPPSGSNEFSRLLWFSMGVAATGFGVWLGARLF